MGTRDHRQKRKRHSNQRPLLHIEWLPINRTRTSNGIMDLNFPVDTHSRYFQQSAYITGGNRVIPNDHSYRVQRLTGPCGSINLDYKIGYIESQKVSGSLQGFIGYRYMGTEDLRDFDVRTIAKRRASSKFFSDLRDSSLNLSVDIAESKQAWNMLTKSVSDVVRIARQCRRDALNFAKWNLLVQQMQAGKPRRGYRDRVPARYRGETDPSVIMANRWLEYKYGWQPLLGTIFGVCDYARNRARRFRVKANSKHLQRDGYFQPTTYGLQVWHDVEQSSYATYSAVFEMSSPLANDVSRFTSLNPLAIAWELVPYSFVVDWFFDIGGFMEECETSMMAGLTFLHGYEVDTHRLLIKYSLPIQAVHFGGPQDGTAGTDSKIDWRAYDVTKRRVRLYSTPWPFLPRLEAKLGASRLLSGAALLRQLFSFSRK
jgi:hypothetical protein